MQTMTNIHLKICDYLGKAKEIDIDTLKNIIAKHCGVEADVFTTKDRQREKLLPRYIFMKVMYKYSKLSLKQVGKLVGNRDHTTVINGLAQLNNLMTYDYERGVFREVMAELKNRYTLKTHFKA
jgi:chromosomal replication initiation ATPase DnaA